MTTTKAIALLLLPIQLAVATAHAQESLLFQDVRVFDGEQVIEATDVLVENGKIAKIDKDIAPSGSAIRIDGTGKTLLPGLIDAHVHINSPDDVFQAAFFGVTYEFDMMGDPAQLKLYQREQAMGKAHQRADMLGAGIAVTIKDGHGTQYGPVPVLESAEAAQEFIDARIAEGSNYIKIAYGGGLRPVMSKEMLKASIDATHQRGLMAVAHIDTRKQAMEAIAAGIDGLVHLCGDELLSTENIAEAKRRGVFIVPTSAVLQGLTEHNSTESLLNDPHIKDILAPRAAYGLRANIGVSVPKTWIDYDKHKANTLALHRAGVPILAGSDSPNPATAHGVTVHHELELLVKAGLTAAEALSAATSKPADAFKLPDCGRIRVGHRANLLLVNGNPITDIKHTRQIVSVWKDGVRVEREAMLAKIEKERIAMAKEISAGVREISNFDKELSSNFGTGWSVATDDESTGDIALSDRGAKGTPKAMKISGSVRAAKWGFSGAWFAPGPVKESTADFSQQKKISFWAKGKDAEHAVMIFASNLPYGRGTQRFRVSPEWKEFTFKISDFKGSDGKGVRGIWFGSHKTGEFEFLLDEVRVHN